MWKIDDVSLAKHLGLSRDLNSSPTAATLLALEKTHFGVFFCHVKSSIQTPRTTSIPSCQVCTNPLGLYMSLQRKKVSEQRKGSTELEMVQELSCQPR